MYGKEDGPYEKECTFTVKVLSFSSGLQWKDIVLVDQEGCMWST